MVIVGNTGRRGIPYSCVHRVDHEDLTPLSVPASLSPALVRARERPQPLGPQPLPDLLPGLLLSLLLGLHPGLLGGQVLLVLADGPPVVPLEVPLGERPGGVLDLVGQLLPELADLVLSQAGEHPLVG